MSDFGPLPVPPLSIHTYSDWMAPVGTIGSLPGRAPVSTSWPSIGRALYHPFSLPWAYPVRRVFWGNGSALGNVDLGIYSRSGKRIYSTGTTVQTPASALQYVPLSPTLWLPPGSYYLGLAFDATTNRGLASVLSSVSHAAAAGLLQQATAFPLPDPMVPAAVASSSIFLAGFTRMP